MTIILPAIIVFIISFIAGKKTYSDWPQIGQFISFIVIISALFTILICQAEDRNSIIKYGIIKDQLSTARQKDNNIELAAMQIKIAEINTSIESCKYYNKWFDEWNNDELCNKELIQ